ncbi:BREX protein BrxB domain-containing protein [Bradyrhizobium sp. SZCCHNR2035]|uniref:BREX protein BrxB domain-containing protein n=1 Tax=Bradyrhizobium sp. SZCCHNR2035 TaxID=3057386 RepID=UPI002916E326|nr:BREX protein BrxB domain-containing protein [Bradyrhizobium sp. SZCCHNR2035]
MASLKADFDELIRRIETGREFAHASFEPIFYLVFPPSELLEAKRLMPAWRSKLTNAGWQVETFSIAEQIADIFQKAPLRKVWMEADRKAPLVWERTNASLANALTAQGRLQSRLDERLSALEGRPSTIMLVTDLEALHPYMRIGAIEAQLQGKFHVPTVFFYPGTRTGKTRLRFLGFYPEDGNYRSVHVGG